VRKFFQRFAPSESDFKSNPWGERLAPLLADPYLFHFNRRSVAMAFAVGLALMWLPLPMQTLTAALTALFVRANVPLSAALVWVTNPITIPPMYFAAYKLGLLLLGENVPDTTGWNWDNIAEVLRTLWKPLFLGCGVMAVFSAVLGYVVVNLLWRFSVVRKRQKRRLADSRTSQQ